MKKSKMVHLIEYVDFKPMERKEKTVLKFQKNQTNIPTEELEVFIKKNCSEWLENPVKIYRIIDYKNEEAFLQTPIKRYSRDNSNYYTLLFDNLNKEYPKRTKSLICSLTNKSYLIDGELYRVIPIDGAKWGVLNTHDIYYSFDKINKYVGEHRGAVINSFFNDVGFVFNEPNNFFLSQYVFTDKQKEKVKGIKPVSDTNYIQFKKVLKKNEKIIKDILKNDQGIVNELSNSSNYFIKFILNNMEKSWLDMIEDVMKDDSIKLKKTSELVEDKTREIWTDSKCVLVPEKIYKNIFQ